MIRASVTRALGPLLTRTRTRIRTGSVRCLTKGAERGQTLTENWDPPPPPPPLFTPDEIDQIHDMERHCGELNQWIDSMCRDNIMSHGHGPTLSQSQQKRGLVSSNGRSIQSMIQPEIVQDGDETKYRLSLRLEDFPPENVEVRLKGRVMNVHAKLHLMSEDGQSSIFHEISRQFTLPEEVDETQVKTFMRPNGTLHIEAPVPENVAHAIEEAGKPKQIPIMIVW